jgi:hypothetical protein
LSEETDKKHESAKREKAKKVFFEECSSAEFYVKIKHISRE